MSRKIDNSSVTMPIMDGAPIVKAIPSDIEMGSYLQLPSSQEISNLAAALSPSFDSFDPDTLVKAALELRLAADRILANARNDILDGMMPDDVKRLKSYFGLKDSFTDTELEIQALTDPNLKALINWRPHYISLESPKLNKDQKLTLIKQKVWTILYKLKGITNSDIPQYPYQMEKVLPFLTDCQDLNYLALESAFKDFIITSPRQIYLAETKIAKLQRLIHELSEKISKLPPESEDSKTLNLEHFEAKREMKIETNQNRDRRSHVAGQSIPKSLVEHANISLESYFPDDEYESHEALIKLTASGFGTFLRTNLKVYIILSQAIDERDKKAKNKFASSGRDGVALREEMKWTKCIDAFFLSTQFQSLSQAPKANKNITLASIAINSFADSYVPNPPRNSIATFFTAAMIAAINNEPVVFVRRELPANGYKTISDSMIANLIATLRSRLKITARS